MFNKILILISFFFLCLPCSGGCTENVKEPAVAGTFYPADRQELKASVESYLSNAQKGKREGRIIALISPHAGYRYSGKVAAYGYKEIQGRGIQKVILIGASHRAGFRGASVYTKGSFRTPLGSVPVNEEIARSLLDAGADITFYPEAYAKEHSLEVQLPFLQTVLKEDFTIIPVLIGSPTRQTFDQLIAKFTDILDEQTLIIASTDLSHYHDYHTAMGMDSRMISAIERLSVIEAGQLLHDGTSEMCGAFPVIITMEVARRHGANLGVLYNYANSGDSLDGKEHVVGYASMGLYKSPLSEQEKQELLAVAKKVITGYVMNGKEPEIAVNNPKFKTDGAVFVTIRKKNALRGCIGDVQAHRPLYQSVIKNAIAACSADPRFPPMTEKELKDIDIEISILSPMNPVKDIKDIQVGKHGLVIRKGSQSGLLLPQVATEQGWNRETFLKNICAKAGLPENAWRDAELYTFSAEVIR